jgi:hypothetical protein
MWCFNNWLIKEFDATNSNNNGIYFPGPQRLFWLHLWEYTLFWHWDFHLMSFIASERFFVFSLQPLWVPLWKLFHWSFYCSSNCFLSFFFFFYKRVFFNIYLFVFCLFIYLFITCKYTVAVFRHFRRGSQISLRVVVSHHVVAGIWTSNLQKSSLVLLPTEPSHQPSNCFLSQGLTYNETFITEDWQAPWSPFHQRELWKHHWQDPIHLNQFIRRVMLVTEQTEDNALPTLPFPISYRLLLLGHCLWASTSPMHPEWSQVGLSITWSGPKLNERLADAYVAYITCYWSQLPVSDRLWTCVQHLSIDCT